MSLQMHELDVGVFTSLGPELTGVPALTVAHRSLRWREGAWRPPVCYRAAVAAATLGLLVAAPQVVEYHASLLLRLFRSQPAPQGSSACVVVSRLRCFAIP